VLRLASIGVVAGFFSALFGVGGGIILVPLLLLVVGFAERRAMATSLAAIGITAFAGAAAYTVAGHLHLTEAALVGVPAALGAVTGTALQQRIAGRHLTLGFAGLLVVIAAVLLLA
jgi:uncharacterized protein